MALTLHHLLLDGLFHWLGSALVVVRHVARLAHAHGVQKAIGVPALRRILIPAVPPVARRAHVLRVVLSVLVGTLRHWLRLRLLELPQVHRIHFRQLLLLS